jgi:hypothetical protein
VRGLFWRVFWSVRMGSSEADSGESKMAEPWQGPAILQLPLRANAAFRFLILYP